LLQASASGVIAVAATVVAVVAATFAFGQSGPWTASSTAGVSKPAG
jgi:hypothetical protein